MSSLLMQFEVTPGFFVVVSEGWVGLSDASGNTYYLNNEKGAPLREKALAAFLTQLHKEAKDKQ